MTTYTRGQVGEWNMRRVWERMGGLKAGRAYRAGIAHDSRSARFAELGYEAALRYEAEAFALPGAPAMPDRETYALALHVGALNFLAHALSVSGLDDSRRFSLLDALALVNAILEEEIANAAARMGPVELRGCAGCEGDAG